MKIIGYFGIQAARLLRHAVRFMDRILM